MYSAQRFNQLVIKFCTHMLGTRYVCMTFFKKWQYASKAPKFLNVPYEREPSSRLTNDIDHIVFV